MTPITSPILQKFEIKGLHGDRNVTLRFNSDVTILVDGNGSGKTTILNALFHILDNKPWKLSKFKFRTAILTFSNGAEVEYERETLIAGSPLAVLRSMPIKLPAAVEHIIAQNYQALLELSSSASSAYALARHPICRRIQSATDMPQSVLVDIIRAFREPFDKTKSQEQQQKLASLFPHHVLYFPTYRRIEEDLNSIGLTPEPKREDGVYLATSYADNSDEELIQFGMGDVKQRIKRITKQMQDSSIEWFSIVSGQMITQLTDGIQVSEEMRTRISDIEMLRIVLERIGANIKPTKKNDILNIVSTGKMRSKKYEPLIYWLFNLSQIYEKQREQDDSIKAFAKVCNSYLLESDKEFRYDESKLQLPIVQKRSNQNVELDNLSSGEKQVVSIFSRLYLMPPQTYAILFDEPELSLSMEWQRKLLCDVANSGRCPLIIAATHSPFIFQNEFDSRTAQLDVQHIEEVK